MRAARIFGLLGPLTLISFVGSGCIFQQDSSSIMKDSTADELIQDLERVFENNQASGNVLAMHIGGAQKVVAATSCVAQWKSYLYGNNPDRAGHYLKITVKNAFGMAFVNAHLPWRQVPPFNSMPASLSYEEPSDGKFNGLSVTSVQDGVLTHVEKKTFENFDSQETWDETTTVTIRFNADFTRVWDLTMITKTRDDVVTAVCPGDFKMTLNYFESRK